MSPASASPVLSVRGLTKSFGGVIAVDGIDLELHSGEVLGVIGPNGAGKSTLVGLVGGAVAPTAGRILLDDTDVTGSDAAHRARSGVGRTHQIPRPFTRMTVLENLLLAAAGVPQGRSAGRRREDCRAILARTGLADVADTPAGGLTLLRRKRLELARALALKPRLLMLDEIGAGLVESETAELIGLINQVRTEVPAVLVIEHVMDVITSCCDRTAVLDFGRLIAVGPTRSVLADPTVAAVYLGTTAVDPAAAEPNSAAARAERQVAEAETRADETQPRALDRALVASLVTVERAQAAGPGAGPPLLEVTDLAVTYGGLRALRGVDVHVRPGETVTLLGANGAGKTTFARAIAGALPLTSGRITFAGQEITGRRPDRVTALGLAQCLEGRRIFGSLSVQENLVLGAGAAPAAARAARLDAVYTIFPVLAERRHRPGTAMSGGQQQMLAVARALMSAPRLVVLDEISLGLAPIAVDRLYEALAAIKASGVAMILVEQNIARGLDLGDRAYVLTQGRIALSGTAAEIRGDPTLTALYVGEAGTGPT